MFDYTLSLSIFTLNIGVKELQPKPDGSQSLKHLLFGTLENKFADSWSRKYSDYPYLA